MSNHHAHHHHTQTIHQNNRAFFLAVSLNFLFTLIEAIYAFIANSMSLLADAGHNLSDVLGLSFAWGANWLLTKPANQRYSYGYKKTTVLAALANALLLVLASGIIGYESILRLLHPLPVTEKIIITVAAIGIIINSGTALLFIRGSKEDLNIKSALFHLAGDALLALGVVVTGIGVLFTGWLWLDPIVGIIIVVTILFGTWGLVKDSINLVMDAVPRHINQKAVQNYLANLSGVTTIHDLHIWGLSTKEVALTAHLVMPTQPFTDKQIQDITHHLKHHFQINHVTLQIEQGDQLNPCEQAKTC